MPPPLSTVFRQVARDQSEPSSVRIPYVNVDLSSCVEGNLLILVVNESGIVATGPAWTTRFSFSESSPGYGGYSIGYIAIRTRTVGASEGVVTIGDAYPFQGWVLFEATVHPAVKQAGHSGYCGVAHRHGRFDVGDAYGDEGFVTADVPIDPTVPTPATIRLEVASAPAVNGDQWDAPSGWSQFAYVGGSAIGPPRTAKCYATGTDGGGGPGGVWQGRTFYEPWNTMGFVGPMDAAGICVAGPGGGWEINKVSIG